MRSRTSSRSSDVAPADRRARPASGFLQHAARGAPRRAVGRADAGGPASSRAHRRGRRRAPIGRAGAWAGARRRRPGPRRRRLGWRAAACRRRALRTTGPIATAAPARRRSRGARAVAHGRGRAVARGPRRRDRRGGTPTNRRRRRSREMLARRFNAPETSSMGRWFDAAAGLLEREAADGVRRAGGDAARRGRPSVTVRSLPTASLYAIDDGNELDLTPLLMRLAGRARRRPRRGAVPRDARRRARGLGGAQPPRNAA